MHVPACCLLITSTHAMSMAYSVHNMVDALITTRLFSKSCPKYLNNGKGEIKTWEMMVIPFVYFRLCMDIAGDLDGPGSVKYA